MTASKPRQIALITGANQGIGLATATALARDHDYHVIIAARNAPAVDKTVADLKAGGFSASPLQVDLDSEASVDQAVATVNQQFDHIDVVINNAAVLFDGKPWAQARTPFTILQQTFVTNVIGTAALTEGLLPLLEKATIQPARIVFVSSIMASFHWSHDTTTAWHNIDYKYYDASKAAVNMLAVNYARILKDTGIKINIVCPGLNKTNMTGYMEWATPPEVGAEHVVKMATIDSKGPTGTFSNTAGPLQW